MKKILTLAAMLIGLSAPAQIDSADIGNYDTMSRFTPEAYKNLYKAATTWMFAEPNDTIIYSVYHQYASEESKEATLVTVNAARFYKFACNGTRGYIFHHDIPVYEFYIYGKLEVEIINQE